MILKQNSRWVLAEADWHSGHKLGLCNPEAQILDPDQGRHVSPTLTEFQRYTWDLRQSYLNSFFEMAGRSDVICFLAGDLTHGNGHMDQLMGTRQADQRSIARANVEPILGHRNVKALRALTGTAVHVFGEGSSEIELVDRLAEVYPKKDIGIAHHARTSVNGVTFDVAHHGPSGGSRAWLKGNTARYYLRDRMWRDLSLGKRPANVYLRGHFHVNVWETLRMDWHGETITSHLVVLPSWCGLGDYARKITRSDPAITNGLYAFEVRPDGLRVVPMVQALDLRIEEEL